MNKGRWASIRLVARRSVCSAVDVSVILVSLRWSAIIRLNLRRRLGAGLLVKGTVRKAWKAGLEPQRPRRKAVEKRLVLQDVDHPARRKYSRIWLFDQLKFNGR